MALPFLFQAYRELLAKLETSHKFQLIADMIGITKWPLVGKKITEFAGVSVPGGNESPEPRLGPPARPSQAVFPHKKGDPRKAGSPGRFIR
jgi:hypothetical protein